MFGGDDKVNAYVDDTVAPAARMLGVKIGRVPVGDMADAVQRVVAERRAGKTSGGSVDLIWLNGENFAAGKKAGLWLKDWAGGLPNGRYLDRSDPAIRTDFAVPVAGQESPWQRAVFLFAFDRERTGTPPRDLDALLAYAKAHPGRGTYPAPPDFTGSAFVRQVVAAKGEDAAFGYLEGPAPVPVPARQGLPQVRGRAVPPVRRRPAGLRHVLRPSFVSSGVRRGQFARSVRPCHLSEGSLQNTSFVTVPAAAANKEGAQVVANLLLSPKLATFGAPSQGQAHC